MESIKFKTNIKCSGCIATVTPFLDEVLGKDNWQVDTNNPAKVLTVDSETDPATVVQAVEKAGYKAEKLVGSGD